MNVLWGKLLILISFGLVVSTSKPLLASQVCQHIAADKEVVIKDFFGATHMARIIEAKKTNGHSYLEVFNEKDVQHIVDPNSYRPIPLLRKLIPNNSVKEVHFTYLTKDVIVEYKNRVELYSSKTKAGKLEQRAIIPARDAKLIMSRGNTLYVATEKALMIAGKNQALIQIPFRFAPELGAIFKTAEKINGILVKVDNDINVIVDYIPKDGVGLNANRIAVFDRETGSFVEKEAHKLVRINNDNRILTSSHRRTQTRDENGKSKELTPVKITQSKRETLELVALELPLVFTGHPRHNSVHQTFMSHAEFKTKVLIEGYIPIFESILP